MDNIKYLVISIYDTFASSMVEDNTGERKDIEDRIYYDLYFNTRKYETAFDRIIEEYKEFYDLIIYCEDGNIEIYKGEPNAKYKE